MPASTRHHKALAVLVHCLGILAALPALPTTAPPTAAAATPVRAATSAPSAAPTANATAPAGSGKVTLAVAPVSTAAPAYRIHVRNDGSTPVDTTVRQGLPPGSSPTTITAGGRATRRAGQADATEITWQLKLPARSTTTLNTALTAAAPDQPLTAPACAFANDGNRPYDCASATWNAAAAQPAAVTEAPIWRRPPALLAALSALLVFTGAGGLWWWRRRRRQRAAAGDPAATADPAHRAREHRGTVYPRPAAPRPMSPRRKPPVWMLVGMAAAVLAGVVGAAAWSATQRVAAIDTDQQPTSGAWLGKGAAGPVGVSLRESAFEFTVYRVSCTGRAGGRQCQATVGVRNVTPERQAWHGQLQRAYLPDGNWVNTDENATRAANQGRDVFAEPVAAGNRLVLPLVFTVAGQEPPTLLELRSGVFSAGVRVAVP